MKYFIEMKGLEENNPRDFLAALGVVRLLNFIWPDNPPAIAWNESTKKPEIRLLKAPSEQWGDQIWGLLKEISASDSNPLVGKKIESITVAELRELLITQEHLPAEFFSAFAGQVQYAGVGRRSHLIIETASRSILSGVKSVLANANYKPDLQLDLNGESEKEATSNTPRWHPLEYRPAAYRAQDPTKSKFPDRPSLNVLATFGLLFYPVVDRQGGRRTIGVSHNERTPSFSWPIWSTFLNSNELTTLLALDVIHVKEPCTNNLRAIGISKVWRSQKFIEDQNNYFSVPRIVG